MEKQIIRHCVQAVYLSESEHVEGRPPRKEDSSLPSKKPTQPLYGAPRVPRPAPSAYARARAGQSLALPRPAPVPRPPARIRPVKSPLRPWRLGRSDPLAGEGEPGARVSVTHPRGVGPPASRPRLPERCRRLPVLATAAGVPEAPSEPLLLRREPVHASACVISRRPSECSQLDSSGRGMPGYRGPVSIATD